MNFLVKLFTGIFSVTFFQSAITQGITLLYGASGEILTERSGNLNMGIPGIMYMGGIGSLAGAFLYEQGTGRPNGWIGVLCAILGCLILSFLGTLIYCVLTITLKANQNVSGLAQTTFGVGLGNFMGGSFSKITGTAGQITVYTTGQAFRTKIPFLSDHLGIFGQLFFNYGFLTYLAILIAAAATIFLFRTRHGLALRAVGENPAAADAASINVTRYKYWATLVGGMIAGFGGMYFVMEYLGGTWQNNGFGDRGWLSVALVIFAIWNPSRAIWGSILFGALYILFAYVPLGQAFQELFKMAPYLVTIIVLVATSLRRRKETQPPASLGLSYFREDR